MSMKHKHHIIPKHMGGSDDPSNLIELAVEEHAQAHMSLYEQFGKFEDLCAYFMLSGKNKDEEFVKLRASLGGTACNKKRKESGLVGLSLFYGREVSDEETKTNASLGGRVQGSINSKSGHMKRVQSELTKEQRIQYGKKGADTCRRENKNSFFDPTLRLKSCTLGGKSQGKINAENGHCKKISNKYWELVRTGQIERVKKKWITDGTNSKLIRTDEEIDNGWYEGRTKTKKI